MAMQMTVSDTDKRDGKALALFATWQTWQRGRTRDGRSFFAIPGSEAGLFHMADQNDCSCPDRQHRGSVCKHMRAVRFWMAAFKTGAVAPRPRPEAPGILDDAGIGDDLVILTPEGAAFLAAYSSQPDQNGIIADLERKRDLVARSCYLYGLDPSGDDEYVALTTKLDELRARLAVAV